MARVLFLGRLKEAAGARELDLESDTLHELIESLDERAPGLGAMLSGPGVRVAVNQALTLPGADFALRPTDEVAFMPPMSGG
jgi:molybdopterin synthase sulfur carrier subunit